MVTPDLSNFVRRQEYVVDIVAKWAEDIINRSVEVLNPDGIPFNMQSMSEGDKLTEYARIKGSTAEWLAWIAQKSDIILQQLANSGMAPSDVSQLNPIALAIEMAIKYSAEMERKLKPSSSDIIPSTVGI